MHDIRLAIGLIGFVSAAVFSLTFRLLQPHSKRLLDFYAVGILALMLAYGYFVWGQLWIVNWIPLPSVLVLSNWFPPLLAALAAVVWLKLGSANAARRLFMMVVILSAAAYSVFHFIPTRPPTCENEWIQPIRPMVWPVCRQTTQSTCSAAAAATILNTLGIETTEQEMAKLCLTRSGTTWLGLYHGLATKLLGTNFHIEFFDTNVAELTGMIDSSPILLCCRLEPEVAEMKPQYVEDGGWIPGAAHSVVYFGLRGDLHVIGDPSRGYERWTTQDLELLWTGTGLRIVLDIAESAR